MERSSHPLGVAPDKGVDMINKEILVTPESWDFLVVQQSVSERNSFHWPRQDRRKWVSILLCGTAALYSTRIIMPICVTALASDMGWNKQESVSLFGPCLQFRYSFMFPRVQNR